MGGRGTNLAQALQLALATAPPGHANRFVLLTDGRQNAGNALAVAQAAKDAGADIYYVPAPLTFKQEVVVESMVLPAEVKFGEPFQAKVVAWSQAETQGRLSLFRNGEFLGSQVVTPQRRQERLHLPAVARAERHPRLPGRHRGRGRHHRGEQPRGGHGGGARPARRCSSPRRTANQAQALAAALRAQHVDVTVVEPDRIPKDAGRASRSTTGSSCPTSPRSR